MFEGITPIHKFGDIYVKREDLSHWSSLDHPSGSKVRQYAQMAANSTVDGICPPCLVGCSANSAQQIYVASTAKRLNTRGIIYTAKRKTKSDATKYALKLGAEVNEIKPGYLSNIRKHARQRMTNLNRQIVEWDRTKAIEDTIAQCKNIPIGKIKRIIVPTGSGLTAAGVLAGTIDIFNPRIEVVAICTSPMADKVKILRLACIVRKNLISNCDRLTVILPATPYDVPKIARLPDGTPLDPFYSAKAFGYLQPGDLLWTPGLRPVISMPEICQHAFKEWTGPQG